MEKIVAGSNPARFCAANKEGLRSFWEKLPLSDIKGFVATASLTGSGQPRPLFPGWSDTTGRISNLLFENPPSSPFPRPNPTLLRFQGYSKQVSLVYTLIEDTL